MDDATHARVVALCKTMADTMPARENIPDDAEYSVPMDGEIVAKYCRHCGRFTKGASQHYTKAHTGTRLQFAYQGPASAPSPTVAPAPVVAAALANLSPTGTPTFADVPQIDTQVFLHRQEVNYDFAAMPVTANLARSIDNDLAQALASNDEEALVQFLLNEFGG